VEGAVYLLCAATALACGVLLLRGFLRSRRRLLLWCGLCFAGLALSNVILILDYTIFPDMSLYRLRLGMAAGALLLMLYGLIFESDQP
jgi:hypothetical protein